ncbi:MAG: MFS transporter [Chloroflexi bacterium]|nr:MFS transporter [Chloroflexota bacterium]
MTTFARSSYAPFTLNTSASETREARPLDHERRLRTARRTLRLAFWEGIPGTLALSIADNFIGPLAIALGGAPMQIGLLNALPQLLAALSQLFTYKLVAWTHSRKGILLFAAGAGVLPWLPMALIPHLSLADPVLWLVPLAILVVALYQFPAPAWGSWVSDLLPLHRRGAYLGLRASVGSLAGTLLVLGMGVFLDRMGDGVLWGFSLIFLAAAAMRLSSLALFWGMHEPPMRPTSTVMSLWAFLRTAQSTNLGRIVLYTAALYFGVFLAGPYFSIFMLRDLHFSYTTFIFLQTVHVVATIIGSRLWGLYADKHGNVNVIRITGLGVSLLPLFWLVSHEAPFLMMINTLGGLCWSGFALCSLNYIYEATPPGERSRVVGYLAAFGGVGLFLGAVTGGLLAGRLPVFFAYPIMTLFLVSGVGRLLACAAFLPFMRESRRKKA